MYELSTGTILTRGVGCAIQRSLKWGLPSFELISGMVRSEGAVEGRCELLGQMEADTRVAWWHDGQEHRLPCLTTFGLDG